MARTHGKDADFSFDSVALEDELRSATLEFTVPEAEITSFSDAWGNFLAGKPTAVLNVDGFLDPAASQGDVTIFGELGLEAEEWDFEPDGSTGYNGFAIVTAYSITSAVDSPITYTASFRHNGTSAAADAQAPNRA
tara:strand:+ start:12058 stop:12465 length:408 start_codon:yes stop_codon:yes gene_type:complete